MPPPSTGTAKSVGPSGATATTTITLATSPLVTNHFSPRIRQPPSVERLRHGRDPRRVRAGVRLRDRVRVLALAAQDRPQPAVDLLAGPGRPHVVGVRDVPGERVRGPAELLLDQRPGRVRPALAAVLAGVEPPVEPRGEAGRADRRDLLRGQPPAGGLRGLLAGDELLVDEAAGALGDLLGRRVRHQRGRHRFLLQRSRPGSPRASASWLATTSRTRRGGLLVLGTGGEGHGFPQPGLPGVAARAEHEPLGERPLAGDERLGRRPPPRSQRSTGGRQEPLRLRGEREPALVAPCH